MEPSAGVWWRKSLPMVLVFASTVPFHGCDLFTNTDERNPAPISLGTDLLHGAAPGVTYYVDFNTGSDSNPGTRTEPWATPEHAISRIVAGDEVVFREGIYYSDPTKPLRFASKEPYGANWDQLTVFRAYQDPNGNYEPVLFTGSGNRPPNIEVEGDYVRIEGLMFGGDWKTRDGRNSAGNEFHAYGGGRLDTGRHIVNCVFFGFNSIRFGALENSYFAGNLVIHSGTGYNLGDPPVLFFSSKHDVGTDPDPEVTHAIVDNNIILNGSGMAIEGWHTWRNFIVTRNIISGTWGGFTTDGIGAEAQSPAGEGRDHVFANNVIWKTTGDTNMNVPRQGAEITSEYTHLIGNIFAGYRRDANTITTQLVLDLREGASDAYYKNLRGLQILNQGYFGIPNTWDWNATQSMQDSPDPRTYVIIDDQSIDPYSSAGYQERKAQGYDPALLPGTLGATEAEIDALIAAIDDLFTGTPEIIHSRAVQFRTKAHELRVAFAVPAGSVLNDAAEAWFDPAQRVDIGWIDQTPSTWESFWNAFSNRGLTQWGRDGNPIE